MSDCDLTDLDLDLSCNDYPNIKYILWFRTSQAANNFVKHSKNNDIKKLNAMFKRGSAIKQICNAK